MDSVHKMGDVIKSKAVCVGSLLVCALSGFTLSEWGVVVAMVNGTALTVVQIYVTLKRGKK
jgi:hypothetical protein